MAYCVPILLAGCRQRHSGNPWLRDLSPRTNKQRQRTNKISINTYLCVLYLIHIFILAPADCKVDNWSPWGDCSVTCNGGTKTKTRNIIQEPSLGEFTCPDLEKTQLCNTDQCEGILRFVFNFIGKGELQTHVGSLKIFLVSANSQSNICLQVWEAMIPVDDKSVE